MNKMLKIDLNMWQTPTERAKEKGYSTQYISTLIRQGKIKFWKIEELNIVLVKRDAGTKVVAVGAAKKLPVVKDLNKPTNRVKPITEPKPKSNYSVNTDYLKKRQNSKLGLK